MGKCIVCDRVFEFDKYHPNQRTCGDAKCYRMLYRVENEDKIKADSRRNREKRWFGGKREEVLKRDNYTCTICNGLNKSYLSVHHKDGNGRGSKILNNHMDNLVTVCNVCHAKLHAVKVVYNKPEYREKVWEMRDKSTREIGRSLGISHTTVRKIKWDLQLGNGRRPK
jgi:hypothetical protein